MHQDVPVTGGSATTAAPPVAGRSLAVTFDFFCFEMLVALGWSWSLRVFRRALLAATLLVMPVVFAGSALVAAVLGALLLPVGGSARAGGVLAAVAVTVLYTVGGYTLREAFSRRRYLVVEAPNRDLFRALDIRARDVFAVYCGLRTVAVGGALMAALLGVTAGLWPRLGGAVDGVVALLVLPFAFVATTLGLAARGGTRPPRVRTTAAWATTFLAIAAVVAGGAWALARLGGELLRAGPPTLPGMTFPALTVAALAATVAGSVALVLGWRDLGHHSFEISTAPETDRRPGRLLRRPLLTGALAAHLQGSSAARILVRLAAALGVLVAGTGGVVAALGRPWTPAVDPGQILRLMCIPAYLAASAAAELLVTLSGPTRMRHHLRFAWERQMSGSRLVTSALAFWTAPLLLLGVLVTAWAWLLAGDVSIRFCVVALAAGLAGVTADCLVGHPREQADGTVPPGLATALAGIAMSLPVLVAAMVSVPLSVALVLLLMGGAATCLYRRVTTLPLASST